MSNLYHREIHCGNCGIASAQIFCPPSADDVAQPQPPDLDTRPNGAVRATTEYWIQECPHCGYCAGDISAIHERAADLIATPEYQRWRTDSRLPDPARRFFAHARLLAHVGQFADAGWTSLHAAWVCDDLGATEASVMARAFALDYWRQARRSGEEFCEPGLEGALITDLLRRMGRFEDALLQCSQSLDGIEDEEGMQLPPLAEHLLRFEKTLIQKRDTAVYNLNDLPAFRARSI